jgi:hypothetical protein
VDRRVTALTDRLRAWRPAPPPLPAGLAHLVAPEDPEWSARELAIAAFPGGAVPDDIP